MGFMTDGAENLTMAVSAAVSKMVEHTYGPNGGFVVISNGENSLLTKDGVSVIRVLDSDSPFEKSIIDIIREASMNTMSLAGDGTTTTVVLANAILKRFKQADFMMKDKILSSVVENINANKREISLDMDGIFDVAMTATSGDRELSKAIIGAFKEAEKYGLKSVFAEHVIGGVTSYEVSDGISFNGNMADEVFFDDRSNYTKNMSGPAFIVSRTEVVGEEDVITAIEKLVELGYKSLVIIAPGFSVTALSALSVNNGISMSIAPIIITAQKEQFKKYALDAIAASVGADIIGEDVGVELCDIGDRHIGTAKSFSIKGTMVRISGAKTNSEQAEQLEKKFESMLRGVDSDEERDIYKGLMAILRGKTVKIKVGAASQHAAIERKDRADDCINAIEHALSNGVMPGGGRAYELAFAGIDSSTDFLQAATDIVEMLSSPSGTTLEYKPTDPAKVIETVATQAIDLAFSLGMTRGLAIKKQR